MSSRRSDSLAVEAPRALGSLPLGLQSRISSAWWDTLRANWALPVALLAVIWIGRWVDHSEYVGAYNRRVVMLIGFNVILAVSLQLINGFSGQFSLGHAGFMAVGAYMAAYPAKELSGTLTDPAAVMWFFIALGILAAVCGLLSLLLVWGLRA